MDLQFYSFFLVILTGIALGLLFDLVRSFRFQWRPGIWVGAVYDFLFWLLATLALAVGLFYGNWGEIRFYVVVGVLIGLLLYEWMASFVMLAILRWILTCLERSIKFSSWIIWTPLLFAVRFLWEALYTLFTWFQALLDGVWRVLLFPVGWLLRPLNGPYRCLRLYYLLAKRRWKRLLRHRLGLPKQKR